MPCANTTAPTPIRSAARRSRCKYHGLKLTCQACPSKARWCPNADARYVTREEHEDARDFARSSRHIKAYKGSRDKRKKVEMLFAHLKLILNLPGSGPRAELRQGRVPPQNLWKLGKLRPLADIEAAAE